MGRQIALLVSRTGTVEYVVVGDEKSILLPETRNYPLGRKRLRGLRLVHTHLKGEPINNDDLNDLLLLRLDLLATLDASPAGAPAALISYATLQPDPLSPLPYLVHPPQPLHAVTVDVSDVILSLEKELDSSAATAKQTASGEERAILISVTKASVAEAEDSLEELKELVPHRRLAGTGSRHPAPAPIFADVPDG